MPAFPRHAQVVRDTADARGLEPLRACADPADPAGHIVRVFAGD